MGTRYATLGLCTCFASRASDILGPEGRLSARWVASSASDPSVTRFRASARGFISGSPSRPPFSPRSSLFVAHSSLVACHDKGR